MIEDIAIIGMGNRLRGDDCAGLGVLARLREMAPALPLLESDGDAAGLLDAWREARVVFVVDAVEPSGCPGRIVRFDLPGELIPMRFSRQVSSHGMGLGESIELATALGALPQKMVIYGIEALAFVTGTAMDDDVERSVDEVASRILSEVEEFVGRQSRRESAIGTPVQGMGHA